MKLKISCSWCDKIVLKFPSQIKGYKYGAFCSRDCLGLFRSAKLTGTLAANFKKGSREERKYIGVLAPWRPGKNRYAYLHRVIAEARAGRFLADYEVVHHVDGNPENNHWENLQIMTQSEHAKEHGRRGDLK